MKLKVLIFIMVAAGLVVQAHAQPKIMFEKLEHDFGTFQEESGIQSYVFTFVNKGNSPLILNNVLASCGCTTPEWTQKPVAPGEKGFVRVSYNPGGRPGAFHKTISVSTNTDEGQTILRITGVAEPRPKTLAELYPRQIGPVRARSNHVSFPSIRQNQVLTDTLEIVNDSGATVQLSFRTPPSHLKVRVEPSVLKSNQKGKVIITYDASKVNSLGFVIHRIYLEVNGKSDYNNSIGVTATIEEDFSSLSPDELATAPVISFNTMSHDFGNVRQGRQVEYSFIIRNDGKRNLILREVKTLCDCTIVSLGKNVVGPGEKVPLKVVFDSRGKRGRQNKLVTVITNDPQKPVSILRVSTIVTES